MMGGGGTATAPLSPILSWGALVGTLAIIWVSVGEPVFNDFSQAGDEIERLEILTAKQKAVIAQHNAYQQALPEAKDGYERVSDALLADPSGQAASAFQAQLRSLASEAGLSLGQIAVEPAASVGPFQKLSLRVRAEGDLEQMHGFLRASYNSRPLLDIAELKVSRASVAGTGRQSLRVEFLVSALAEMSGRAGAQ